MQHVALLRGINVGGGNRVPMADLRDLCEAMGWTDVKTYIASGNLVFQSSGGSDALAAQLRATMAEALHVDVPALVLTGQELMAALSSCPVAPERGAHLHAAFSWIDPEIDWSLFRAVKAEGESLHNAGRTTWIHTPGGYGQSKLADSMPKILGVDYTARNLNTLRKLADMLAPDLSDRT